MACGPGHPELSKSCMDMASKLFTFTFTRPPRLAQEDAMCVMCSCLRGFSKWLYPLACGPGSPELSESYTDMASELFTFTFTFTFISATR